MMKRLSLLGLLVATMGLLAGCPIFDDSGQSLPNCENGCGTGGQSATSSTSTGVVNPNACSSQAQCVGINQTCGKDGSCHTGDCTIWDCVGTDVCTVGTDMKAHCGPPQSTGTGTGTTTGTGTGGATMTGSGGGGAAMTGGGGAAMTGSGGATTGTGGAGGAAMTGGGGAAMTGGGGAAMTGSGGGGMGGAAGATGSTTTAAVTGSGGGMP